MQFKKFIWLEVGRLLSKRYITVLLIFLVVFGYFVQYGIGQYKHILREKVNFQEFEEEKVKNLVYIVQYGLYGIRVLFVPSPFMAFFDCGSVPNHTTAFIDSSERMKVYQPLKGQNAFVKLASLFMTPAGYILLFGSLVVLLYGFDTIKNHEWLKFLESKTKNRKELFLFLVTSRVTLLFLICLALAVISLLLFIINGVGIDVGKVLIYTIGIFMLLLFFWLIGLGAGAANSWFTGLAVSVTLWFLLAFLVPVLTCHWTYSQASTIQSPYKMEAEKQKIFLDYERKSLEEGGKFDESKYGTEKEKQMFLDFWNNGFKRLMELEKDMLNEMKAYISSYQTLAGFCPTTFFLSLSNEVSSLGFSNLVYFHERAQKMKKDFIWFIANLFLLSKKKEFEPFIKGNDGNIFHGKSRLPDNFGFGFMTTVLWIVLLFGYSWISFNRLFNRVIDTDKELKPDDFKKNRTTVVLTKDHSILPRLTAELRLQKSTFVSVPDPAKLPGDVKVKDLLAFFDRAVPGKLQPVAGEYVHTLDLDYKGLILLEITRSITADFFIFNKFLSGLSDELINYFTDYLKTLKKGRKVVYFTNSLAISSKLADDVVRFTQESRLY